jgi:hypothetical protein
MAGGMTRLETSSLLGRMSMAYTISTRFFGPPAMGIDGVRTLTASENDGVTEGRLFWTRVMFGVADGGHDTRTR